MKKYLGLLLLIGVTLYGWSEDASQAGFDWTITLETTNHDAVFSAERPVALKTGDIFSLTIKAESDCYAYVLAEGANSQVFVLYSGGLRKNRPLETDEVQLTGKPGTETFYVVMSREKQAALDTRIKAFNEQNDSRQLAQSLLNEVYSLRKALSSLKEKAEKPIMMGGSVRGMANARSTSISFTGQGSYVKTFRFTH